MAFAESTPRLKIISWTWVQGRQRSHAWLVPSIIGLHLSITLFLSAQLTIWIDEAYSLATSDRSGFETLRWAIGFEEQAPLYFLVLWLFRQVHDTIWMARLPSVLAIGMTLWLSSRISRRLFPSLHPGWITAALAFNPYIVAIAVEIRGYALAVLLSALLLERFLVLYAQHLSRGNEAPGVLPLTFGWGRLGYVLVALIALHSHYFLACQVAAQGGGLLAVAWCDRRRRRRAIASFSAYCLDSIAILALALPLMSVISHQLEALADNTPILEVPSRGAIAQAAVSKAIFRNLVFLLPSDPVKHPGLLWQLIRLGLGLGLVGVAWEQRQRVRFPLRLLWGIHGGVMGLLLLLFSWVSDVEYRHGIVLIILSHLSALGLATLVSRRQRRYLLGFITVGLLCINSHSLWQSYHSLAKAGDYARVAQLLEQRVQPDQSVAVFNGEVAMSLAHYYPQNYPQNYPQHSPGPQPFRSAHPGPSTALSVPRPALVALPQPIWSAEDEDVPRYNQAALTLQGPAQIVQALAVTLPASSADGRAIAAIQPSRHPPSTSALPLELWLVTDSETLTAMPAFDQSYRLLEAFVQEHYQEIERHQFQGSQVRYLRRKTDS